MSNLFKFEKGTKVLTRIEAKHNCLASNVSEKLTSGCWKNETCFIIGGGPSLKNFNWDLLKGYKVIGINKAFTTYPVDINYAMDYTFFDNLEYGLDKDDKELRAEWQKFEGIKLFALHDKKYVFKRGIYYINELNKKGLSFDLNSGIYFGSNSGTGALMLALALGSKRIGLLGYDFKISEEDTHWHKGYKYQNITELKKSLKEYKLNVEEFASGILELGIEVFNLSNNSDLVGFPFSDIQTFLRV